MKTQLDSISEPVICQAINGIEGEVELTTEKVIPLKRKQSRKSRKEYDLFRESKKELLGNDYPPEGQYGGKHWSVEQFREFLKFGYSDQAKGFILRLDRLTITSPAYMALSLNARGLYTICLNSTNWEGRKYDKRNGGRAVKEPGKALSFYLPYNLVLAHGGFKSPKQIAAAFRELQAFGFLRQIGESGLGEANIYKICTEYLSVCEGDVARILENIKHNKTKNKKYTSDSELLTQ